MPEQMRDRANRISPHGQAARGWNQNQYEIEEITESDRTHIKVVTGLDSALQFAQSMAQKKVEQLQKQIGGEWAVQGEDDARRSLQGTGFMGTVQATCFGGRRYDVYYSIKKVVPAEPD